MKCLFLILSLLMTGPRFVNYSAADGMPSNTVYAIAQDSGGTLWIGTRNGLASYDGTGFRSWKDYGRVNALTVTGRTACGWGLQKG
jgi:ligand-binding sensor domain-containing protein